MSVAETGQRIDDNDDDNLAMAGLFGAMARLLEQTPPSYQKRDDVAAGVLIRHQMSHEYARKRESDRMLAQMLTTGMSPDSIADLFGMK